MKTIGNKERENFKFGQIIETFEKRLDTYFEAAPQFIGVAEFLQNKLSKEIRKLAEKHGSVGLGKDSNTFHANVRPEAYGKWKELDRKYQSYLSLHEIMPETLLVTIISLYDAYLGNLLRGCLLHKPHGLDSNDKFFSYQDLLKLGSVETALEILIEDKIENILRKSHSNHFEWLEKFLGINLKIDLECWSDFIELTERRNLFVHTGGVVSSQYLKVCDANDVKWESRPRKGSKLSVERDYIRSAYRTIREVGTKLGFVVWNKLRPEESEDAGKFLTADMVDLLNAGHDSLVVSLADFYIQIPIKNRSESTSLIVSINKAIALKSLGRTDQAEEVIKSISWSTLADQYRLAHACLTDNWSDAANLMRKVDTDGSIGPREYQEWPIFKDFRQTDEFLEIYAELHGELVSWPIVGVESTSEKQINSLNSKAGSKSTRKITKRSKKSSAVKPKAVSVKKKIAKKKTSVVGKKI